MTALMAWPTFILEMEERSTNRWQHRLKREHPTCTERNNSLIKKSGWKGVDSGTRQEKNLVQRKNKRTHLPPTALLMKHHYTQHAGPMPTHPLRSHSHN